MSGQWEVVGKKKDRGSKLPLPKTNDKTKKEKKNILNGVKIEEILPKSQVQNLYSSGKNQPKKVQEKTTKSEVKKIEKKVYKPAEPTKPKPPKSIESALDSIDVKEFTAVYEKSKSAYPDAPIVWLKELVQFLNQKIPVEVQDPVFSTKPQGYPLSAVPSSIKTVIERSVKEAGKNNAQLFFDIALTSMVTDISKGLPGIGYKFYLQHIALTEPELVSANVNKHITLRNSYQNRANVALSILWAVGHVGISDFQCGLNVFQELMLPLLEMKNFSKYIAKYLLNLISREDETHISKEQYLLMLDIVYSAKKNLPTELQKELSSQVPNLQKRLFKNKEKYHNHFEVFLKSISTNSNKTYQNCLCENIITIFGKDQSIIKHWIKIYPKNVTSSAMLLDYIRSNFSSFSQNVSKTSLNELLDNLQELNEELSTRKRKEEGLKHAIASLKEIKEKLSPKEKRSSFFGRFLKFLLVVASLGVIYETLHKVRHGRFEDSSLRKIGGFAGCGFNYLDARFAENFPEYRKKVIEVGEPYAVLVKDFGKIVFNLGVAVKATSEEFIKAKLPIVKQSIDKYAPGLLEQSQKTLSNVYSTTILYYDRSVEYLRKEVFVGQFSPENMQKVVLEAFNSTSRRATEYYHWLYEKVQTTIK